jgi:hypothetical protein
MNRIPANTLIRAKMIMGEYCIHGFSLNRYNPIVKREKEISAPTKDPYPIIPNLFPYASDL